MNQAYLDIARSYLERNPPPQTEAAAFVDDALEDFDHAPVPLAAYRTDGEVRRCRICAHVLSVVAVRDICGRCASPYIVPEVARERAWPLEASLRGQLLVALDKRGYPRIPLADGRSGGPGLLRWGPVLRELNATEMEALLEQLKHVPVPTRNWPPKDDDAAED